MSEGKKSETIESAVIEYMDSESKEIAGKELGKTVVTLTKTINTILLPIQTTVYGFEKIQSFLLNHLKNRFQNIPIENIVHPRGNITGPALESLKYLDDNQEDNQLKEMYANLIASAMNKETKESVHPAFVEIIKQLEYNDILFLEAIREYEKIPFLNVSCLEDKNNPLLGGKIIHIRLVHSSIYQKIKDYHLFFFSVLENLERLKIITVDASLCLNDQKLYDEIRHESTYQDSKNKYGKSLIDERGVIRLTHLGYYFLKACLD